MHARRGDRKPEFRLSFKGVAGVKGLEMDGAAGEESDAVLRVAFDPRLKLAFHGSRVTSDAGLLPFRDLDDVLGLTDLAGEALTDIRTGQNSRHTLIAQLRQPGVHTLRATSRTGTMAKLIPSPVDQNR